jgi:hypothetical protein
VLHTSHIEDTSEEYVNIDDVLYENCNYYSDKTVAENNARADKLMRQLRRFAVEHRNMPLTWERDSYQYCIYYDHGDKTLVTTFEEEMHFFGCIYFDSEEAAQEAIETFRDELIWYFTEYKDSL